MSDYEYMRMAIELAKNGAGHVNPNPMVGAIIVKNGIIIGKGYHQKYGQLHAERNALANCTESPDGATMYVTLEPCCHYGKTPPCTEAIIQNKIATVVIGSSDPNPLVAGKGIEILKQNGIEVVEGVLKEECDVMNEVFFHYIKTKTPMVIMKYAMTMDGKIATYTGASKWITGESARNDVHRLRNMYTGIMVGVNTVIMDNPMLTCRMEGGRNPIRIICDTTLKTPMDCNIVNSARDIRTIIATACKDTDQCNNYTDRGCEIVIISKKDGHIDLQELMVWLGNQGIDSILLEGGASLNYSAMASGIVNEVKTYISPKIFGGMAAKTPMSGQGVEIPDQAFRLVPEKITYFGEDILIESKVINDKLSS